MTTKKNRRRGVVLSSIGQQKLEATRRQLEKTANMGDRLTLEELSERTQLAVSTITRVLEARIGVDKLTLDQFFAAFDLLLERKDYHQPQPEEPELPIDVARTLPSSVVDWGDAIDIDLFYGRTEELTTLEQWMVTDRCRLVALLGMGGMGKSSLAAKIAHTLKDRFESIVWRSLRHAPPLENILSDLVSFLSGGKDAQPQPERLLYWLRQSRCLVIFDNLETILQAGDRVGYYQPGYENYGDLLRLLGETNHPSCVLLTSREKPAEIATFEGVDGKVQSLSLAGCLDVSSALIEAKGLIGTEEQKRQLCEYYSCSPLALKIVASSIQSLFDRQIAPFLAEETLVFNGLRRLLDQQFDRLSEIEKTIMYWLAIARDSTTISQLAEDIVPTVTRASLLESLESLTWRSLIDRRIPKGSGISTSEYTQQSVVMEYMTDRLTTEIGEEIISLKLDAIARYALIKTNIFEYIREGQIKLILQPIANNFIENFPSRELRQAHVRNLLSIVRQSATTFFDYSAGNLLNLGIYCQLDLAEFDWSNLKIRQVNFQGKELARIDLAQATLRDCLFTQIFGGTISLAFSPDGKMLASSDTHSRVFLWQNHGDSAQPDRTLTGGHRNWVMEIAWSPDNQRLVSGGSDYLARIWDTRTGTCLQTLAGHQNSIWTVAWHPDGNTIATAGVDRTIKIWHPDTGECLKTLAGHEHLISSIAWSPDGKILASGCQDQTCRLWDVEGECCIKVLSMPETWFRKICWSPDSKILATATTDGLIRLWDVRAGEIVQTLTGHALWIEGLAWSPDGRWLASSGSIDKTVKIWNPHTGECLQTMLGHRDLIWGLAWSPDSKTLVSSSHDQTMRFWSPESGRCRRTLTGYTNWIGCVAWSPDGTQLVSGSTDRTVRRWDIETGACVATLTGHTGWVYTVAWHPTRPIIASAGTDAIVRLWDSQTGTCIRTLNGHQSWIWSIAWSPDGKYLASGSSINDLTTCIWHPDTGERLQVFGGHQSWIWSVRWNPDGTILATAGDDNRVNLWDVATGECLKTFHTYRLSGMAIAWSPDGSWLAISNLDCSIGIWNVTTGECDRELTGHRSAVLTLAWSPDGRYLASGSDDLTIKLWHHATAADVRTLLGSTHLIWDLAWSHDSSRLASASTNETIGLWDVRTGDRLKVLSSDRPYEGMNITGIKGISAGQSIALKVLGAVEEPDT